ncbi:MAG TPA: YncE family protein [Terriglobales bacterium]|nr:YncE family protein [Terriglobales bacterium]
MDKVKEVASLLSCTCRLNRPNSAAVVVILLLLVCLLTGCGDTFRPVALPILTPTPNPAETHTVVVVNNNAGASGTTNNLDVSGDSNVLNRQVGRNPVHAALRSDQSLAFVVNNVDDTVTTYSPRLITTDPSTVALATGSGPVFVLTAGTGAYVANAGNNTVAALSSLGLTQAATAVVPVGNNPVALAITPDGKKVYCLNKDSGTVTVINTSDNSIQTTITVGSSPVWAVMSPTPLLFVLNQGSGTVSVIDPNVDTVIGTLNVGSGATEVIYDPRLTRLYVANFASNTVSVFNAGTTIPTLITTLNTDAGPRAVTALSDGTRFYVANSIAGTVSVFDAISLAFRKTIPVGTTPYWIDSSPDSTKVFTPNRDSNNISVIRTTDDTVAATVPSASPSPVFLVVQ